MSAVTKDRLMQYLALYQNTMIALAGIADNPMGWKLFQRGNPNGPKADVEAVNGLIQEWWALDADGLADELENNTLSTIDRAALVEVYNKRLKQIGTIENKAGYIAALDYGDCVNADVFTIKVECLIDILNGQNNRIADALLPILGDDGEPQPQPGDNTKRPLMQITQEAIDGLKHYFVSQFKGMGNNPDRFTDNLIPALKQCQTKKEIAALALACYKSASLIKNNRPKSWNKWVNVWCTLFSIERLPYKMNELPEPDFDYKYFWLQPPKNSR